MIDNSNPVWLGLDTSIKVTGYTYNTPLELSADGAQLSAIRDEYLSTMQTETPLEYFKEKLSASSGQQAESYRLTRSLIPEVMNILPSSMQYDQLAVTHEYTEIPDDLKHKVKFTASDANNSELFSISLNSLRLSNRKITLSYEPETVEDQQIIDSYGGLDNTPAYLVRLRPLLKVDGEMVVAGKDGLPMGTDYNLTIELISPNGTERITSTQITANLSAIGTVAQKALDPEQTTISEEDDAETILFKETNRYIDNWNKAEDELAALLHLQFARPVPTITTIGGVLDVTYLLDIPHGFEWKGVYVDAGLRAVGATPSRSPLTQGGDENRQKTFMQLSALQGSVLENRIFEDDFQVESISTAKLFQVVGANCNTPSLLCSIATIDKTNVDTLLPTLDLDDNIKEDITNAVNQGLVVRIPQSPTPEPQSLIFYKDWTGIGYIKESPATGEAGYMLSGMIAGGMSVILPANWVNTDLRGILSNPNAMSHNDDPMSASAIAKITATDRQRVTVGGSPARDPEVIVVDNSGKRVRGATVTFTVVAGGGVFGNGNTTYDTITDINGMASAKLYTGTKTETNPGYMRLDPSDQYVTQIGVNVIAAAVKNSTGTISLSPPFQIFGIPDAPVEIRKSLGDGVLGLANNPMGSFVAKVVDKHGNSISNRKIKFITNNMQSRYAGMTLPLNPRGIEFYDGRSCANPYPLYGDCPSTQTVTVTTEYYGAVSTAFLGDTVGTKYTVEAKDLSANIPPAYFELYTKGFRSSDGYIPPGIYLRQMQILNDKGEPVNASKAGTPLKAPLIAEFILMREDVSLNGPFVGSSGQGNSWVLTTSGKVITEKIPSGTVAFTPVQGGGATGPTTNLGNGKYQTTYTTGPQPMVNAVEAGGQATIRVPKVLYNPMVTWTVVPSFSDDFPGDLSVLKPMAFTEYVESVLACTNGICRLPVADVTLNAGQQAVFYAGQQPVAAGNVQREQYKVFGVDVGLTLSPKYILLNDKGYSYSDAKLEYTILPPEYSASTADIDIMKNGIWEDMLTGGKTQGTDSDTIAAGSVLEVEADYKAQVVLNRGTDAEIIGQPLSIPIGQFRMVDDEDGKTPVIGAVTDGAAKIRLQLTVKNNQNAFDNLAWRIVDPQLTTPQVGTGTLLDGSGAATTVLPVVFNNGVAGAVYQAPDSFVRWTSPKETEDKDAPERYIQPTFDLVSYLLTGKDLLPPIHLKRPPVVLVHGLWGDASAWDVFEPKFNDKGFYENQNKIRRVNYFEEGQVRSIFQHITKLKSKIDGAINEAKENFFAVDKVDIIAHSMGGLLTRAYCDQFSVECQDRIRRFVTIATPHFGSELADLLLVYRDDRNHFPDLDLCRETVGKFIRGGKINIFGPLGKKIEAHPVLPLGGAIDDLATGRLPAFIQSSTIGGHWSDPAYLPLSTSLSAHAIIGLTPPAMMGIDIEIWGLWKLVLSRCGFTRENVFGAEYDTNDRIVRRSSQEGGVLRRCSTEVIDTDHFTVRIAAKTIAEIRILLDEPLNSQLFTK
ncbi:MAG: hypothetical protein HZB33_07390 [Nitrospirae bacterium]|nr:hypothetical protein [Nitrospirota bacterium]